MTQEQLAWSVDLKSKGYLSRIESGQRLPSLDLLSKLAHRLEVEPRDLLVFPDQDGVARAMESIRRANLETVKRAIAVLENDAMRTGPMSGLRAAEPARRRRVRSARSR